jgi:anaerobic magnesium-protoporphyrin IX monomethyl ester cyclase
MGRADFDRPFRMPGQAAMRIAFVDQTVRFSIPLGTTGVASMLRRGGHEIELFVIGRAPERAIGAVRAWNPDAVGFSAMTGSHQVLLDFARRLKERLPTPTIFGGPHPTFFPEIIELPWVDAVCRGEGEEALLEFVDLLGADDGRLPETVRNFWVKRGGGIVKNPVRPRNRSLDDLPFPARDLYLRQFPILRHHGVKHFMAHRGCPNRCTYCFNDAYNTMYRDEAGERRIYHSRSPENILAEILDLQRRTDLRMVGFVDDVFALDRKWVFAFAEAYARRCSLPFSINARFESLEEDVVAALAGAGLRLVYCGVESGDEFFRNRVMLRRMGEEVMLAAAERCRKHGVKIITENIIGLPGETYAAAARTLEVNTRIRPDLANASLFAPYPRLPLTEYAAANGYFDDDYDRLRPNYYHESAIRFPSRLDRNRILNLRCFFSLLAHHPRLLPVLEPLLRIPPNPLFRLIGDLIDGYYIRRCVAYRMTAADFLRTVRHYLVFYR